MEITPLPAAKTAEQKETRANSILQAALSLFLEKGFSATRLEDVAQHAGVSKGTLYLYFESKEAMFKRLVEEMILPLVLNAESEVNRYQGSCNKLLQQLLDDWWTIMSECRISGLPKLLIAESGNFPELAQFYMQNVVARVRRILIEVLVRGMRTGEFTVCDADAMARVIMSTMVFPVVLQHSLGPYDEPSDPEQYRQANLSMILGALVKKI